MSIGPPIPEIQHFQNLTLKIKGQGNGWGHSLKSQCRSNILSTHFPFAPCQSGIPFLSYDLFKIWPWKSRVKVIGWGHNSKSQSRSNILSTHIPFVPCQSGIPFLSYDFFKVWPWKSKVKVMGEVDIENHNVEIQHFQNLTLKIKGHGQMTLMLHNYRSRQFHRFHGSHAIGGTVLYQCLDSSGLYPRRRFGSFTKMLEDVRMMRKVLIASRWKQPFFFFFFLNFHCAYIQIIIHLFIFIIITISSISVNMWKKLNWMLLPVIW